MIAVLRIVGSAAINRHVGETLMRLNIHRKLACTLIDKNDLVKMGMLKQVVDYVAYEELSDEMVKKIIAKRGQTLMGKPIAEKDIDKVFAEISKGTWNIKKFFRLHPPIGGFKKSTKIAYPKGVLGHNKDLAKLIERML